MQGISKLIRRYCETGYIVLATSLDLAKSVPVDYMHCAIEGVGKWLLNAWTDSKNKGKPYYLGGKLKAIDEMLISQRPPQDFTRPPRAIARHKKYWKASELRTWLLFYALPLVLGSLPPLYVHHTALLVASLHIFLRQQLTETKITAAETMLQSFHQLLPELYGEASCTANAHCLTHTAKFVRLWGPLWTHSAFGFESMNGHLKSLFHSRYKIYDQLVFSLEVNHALQQLCPVLAEHESEATLSYLTFSSSSISRKSMSSLGPHQYSVGRIYQSTMSSEEAMALRRVCGIRPPKFVSTFDRLHLNGVLYHSVAYSRGQGKRNSCVCSFTQGTNECRFGVIQKFCITVKNVAIVHEFTKSSSSLLQRAGNPGRQILKDYAEVDLLDSFVHEVKKYTKPAVVAVPLEDLGGVCVHVVIPNTNYDYVVQQPNCFEHH